MTIQGIDGNYLLLKTDDPTKIGIEVPDNFYIDREAALWLAKHLLELALHPERYVPVHVNYDV